MNTTELNLNSQPITFRRASLHEIISLRYELLIADTDRNSPYFVGDDDPGAYHFGAFLGEETIGCLSWLPSEFEGGPAYQLRGMATRPEFRGQGIGRRLLEESEKPLREQGVDLAWCNARVSATAFYQKLGWTTVSDEFMIEGVGPHIRMKKQLQEPVMNQFFYKIVEQVEFSDEKMKKVNLFESPRMFCDIYCLKPGQLQKDHDHVDNDKIYYVISGQCNVRIGEETHPLGAGELAAAPAGVIHGVTNESEDNVVLLVIMAPHPSWKG